MQEMARTQLPCNPMVFSPCPLSSPSPHTALLLRSFSGRGDPTEDCTLHILSVLFYYEFILEPKINLSDKQKPLVPACACEGLHLLTVPGVPLPV